MDQNKGRRKIKAIVALQQKREKINISRQGRRKIVKNKNNPISFDEFKQDDKFNKEIGVNEDELEKIKPLDIDFDPNEIVINESHLDEESFNFTPFERSVSIVNENVKEEQDEFVHENPIEIVEQNSFDKLENYKDKLPCLHLRKSLLRIKRIINKSALTIISNPIFDYSCLSVIIANSIALSMYDPLNPTASDTGFLGSLDTVFLAWYSLEMVLKIVGLGFVFNKGAYLRDSWNILDFVIVVSAYLQLAISSGANLSVLRSFRVLRPLRTISGIEGLRVIVTALLKAISLLVDTAIILLFFFIIFAIAGLQLFGGILRQQCINIETGQTLSSIDVWGTVSCPAGYICAKSLSNPNYGVSNFDNIFYSLLMAYQSVTLEGWTYNMIYVEKSLGWMTFCYFLPLIYIGAFFLLTLTLVVINSKFAEEHEANKQKKKRQKFILQKQASKVDKVKEKEAKKALNRIRVKNKKIYMSKIDRKDSDDSLAQKKHFKTLDKLKREEIVDKINADLPPYSRAFASNKPANIRPIFGINDVSMKIRSNDRVGKDVITEEISNSQMSMLNQNNIFYPSKGKSLTRKEKDVSKKDRNIIFDNKTKRKVKMEGMYGISKAKNKEEENGVGSYSDLLQGIPLTDNSEEEVSNGTDNYQQNVDNMFPYDSSMSATGDKSNSKANKNNGDIKICKENNQLSISEESMDIANGNTIQSPEKVNSKNDNAGNKNPDENEPKLEFKKLRFAGINSSEKQKNTKFSAKIEDENDSPFINENAMTDFGGTITDFNIRSVLNINLIKKKNEEDKENQAQNNEINSEELELEENNKRKDNKNKRDVSEETFENLENVDPDQIQIVKKGKKIFVKRNDKEEPIKDTVPADILLQVLTEEKEHKIDEHHQPAKKIKKTYLAPYDIKREMVVNEQLLEGKIEKEVEDKKDEDGVDKPRESEKKKEEGEDQDKKIEDQDDDKNPYLEKFKYAYLSDLITTGTISIVIKTNNIETLMNIPNPCAVEYGNILIDDDNSDIEDSRLVTKEKVPLRRNDTILPGGLARQITNLSKTNKKKQTKSKTANRIFGDKNAKKKGRDMEELTDEVVLRRIILDIPKDSRFYQKEFIEKYDKEQAEDKKLEEENREESEDEFSETDSDENLDIFLDREINFEKEIKKAWADSAKRKNDKVDWSGQDIKIDYDPYFATSAADQMSNLKIFPKSIYGKLVKIRFYIYWWVTSSIFDNIMTIVNQN